MSSAEDAKSTEGQIPTEPANSVTPKLSSHGLIQDDPNDMPGPNTDTPPPVTEIRPDTSPLILTIPESQDETEVLVMSPRPGTSKTSFPTKLKLFLQGAYRRVTPSLTDMEGQPIKSTGSGPCHAQDQLAYNVQVSNNNLANNNEGLTPTPSAVVTDCHRTHSVESTDEVCRICHDNGTIGNFITPCLCKGTMSLVHQKCLERWLGESGKTSCEICNYEYVTKRTPKFTGCRSIYNWIRKPVNPNDTKNLCFDVACFFILTPLATISAWLCILGSQHYAVTAQERFRDSLEPLKNSRYREIHDASNSTWTSIGLLTLTGTLLTAYYIWLYVAFRYHYQIWRDWQGRNFQVTVIPVSPEVIAQTLNTEGNGPRSQGVDAGRSTTDDTVVDIVETENKSDEGQVEGGQGQVQQQ